MPELPEVESVRRALEGAVVGARVRSVLVRTRSMVVLPGDPPAGWSRARSSRRPARLDRSLLLEGAAIERVDRLGKQLAIVGDAGPAVGVHLGMTGALLLGSDARPHTHVVWTLADGREMSFVDPRRFGLVAGHRSMEDLAEARWAPLGPDALALSGDQLGCVCAGRARAIKAVLLDQSLVAGVGNIYADEALFASCIHPERAAGSLTRRETTALARAVRTVLARAIRAGGSTIRDYRGPGGTAGNYQGRHAVYGRAARPCRVCGSTLEGSRVAQRMTVHCPNCQGPPG